MNKYIDYAWLKYINSTNKSSEFIWKNIFKILSFININLIFFILAIMFSLCDTISSILCMNIFSYNHESNLFIRYIMQNFGIIGFIFIKIGITIFILLIIYYIIKKDIYFGRHDVKIFYGIYLGIIISNAYVSISNISVLLGNNSFYLLNLNIIETILLFCFLLLFLIFLYKKYK